MWMSDESYFLIIFDHAAQELIDVRQYSNPEVAVKAYEAAEAEHRAEGDLEIVLVGADSIETVHSTHGQYFRGDRLHEVRSPSASKYLAGV